jgi:RND family efflux transporter MFP subunit
VALGLAAGGLLLLVAASTLLGTVRRYGQPLIYYTVTRGDLPITVTERGNLESQDEVKIFCEVDDIHGDGVNGTTILSIVPNGSSVKEGDLLVELDSSGHQERLDEQILDTEKARSEQIQAQVKYENQKTQNETMLAEAKLKVSLAELALKQFEDEEGGTFQIELQNVELQIQEARAGRLIEQTNLEGVEQLYKLGYRSSGELAQARLSALRAERQLATAISRKKELVQYQYEKSKMELEGARASARRNLTQVTRDNEALLEQARAKKEAADEALKKEEELLARYRDQVTKCRIYAPQDGMVAYAVSRSRWRREAIDVGVALWPRQQILSIPNLKKMQVKTAVHESVLDKISPGLPVTIRVDAFPGVTYRGEIETVAVLPDQGSYLSSDTKVYETVVTISEEVEQLKPGMTAVVEIHVDRLTDVVSIPVQAVVQVDEDTWCYVGSGSGVERRSLTLGASNEKFVEVSRGLQEGDRVVLNPTAIIDESSRRETPIGPEESEGKQREGKERDREQRPLTPVPGGDRWQEPREAASRASV